MAYEDKILDFLAQPENLGVAMQVAEYVQKLREKTHRSFWPAFSQAMKLRLDSSIYGKEWEYVPLPEENWNKQWSLCHLRPAHRSREGKTVLQASLQQGSSSNHFQLLIGVNWINKPPGGSLSSAYEELRSLLKTTGYTYANDTWPGWKVLDYRLRGENFIQRAYQEAENQVNEVADIFWQFFLDIRPLLDAVNQEALERGNV